GLAQLFMQLQPLRKRGIYIRPAWQVRSEAFRKIIVLMGPMILGLTVTQINTLADDFIALWFSGSPEKGEVFLLFGREIRYPMWEGAVSQLFYSQRLYQFPLGVLGISLATAIFPVMSAGEKGFRRPGQDHFARHPSGNFCRAARDGRTVAGAQLGSLGDL
ncbi:MAG: lipid II flippase MurJ, partial [Planctomycetota bacterium]